MKKKIMDRLIHALIALLLSAGITMAALGILDESFIQPRVLLWITAIVLAFEAASLSRISSVIAASGLAAGALFWLFASSGARTVSDVLLAMSHRIQGNETALPLITSPVMLLTTLVLTIACCFACMRKAAGLPAVLLCIGTVMLIWITNRMNLVPWLLPALAATLTLILAGRFEDANLLRILPWAAVLTAAAFLIAGNGRSAEPLKQKADEFRQSIMDRLFFTEARDVFSLYAAGFSPQGPDQLGGKPNPDPHNVMQVSTPKMTYLRGTIYDLYDGHAWKNTTGGRRYLWQSGRTEEMRISLFDQNLPPASVQNSLSTENTVSVRMLNDGASTLFVPQRIRTLIPGGELVPYFSNSSEVFVTRNLQAGDAYAVSAPLYSSGDPGISALLDICAGYEDPAWDSVCSVYLSLPGHLEQPVFDLARNVTSVAQKPFEKAVALQNYLRRNFRYSMDVGEHPENIDFVTSFLMDTRKGYCTYFASAMTVLCRMAGLPARYVEGYLAQPNDSGEALVTGMDAHAWTEVYFSGFGWLTFDATPGQSRETPKDNPPGTEPPKAEQTPEPSPETEETPTPEPDSEPPQDSPEPTPETGDNLPPVTDPPPDGNEPEPEREPDRNGGGFPWIWLLLLIPAALAAIRCVLTSPGNREKRCRSEDERFSVWVQEITDILSAEKLSRKKGESPMAWLRRVDGTGYFSVSLQPVGECISLIRYSSAAPVAGDTALVRDTAVLLRGETSRNARLAYWARRIFLPAKRHEHTC